MKTGLTPAKVALLFSATFIPLTLILVLISYSNGKNLLEYMIRIYMALVICITASYIIAKETKKIPNIGGLDKKYQRRVRLLTVLTCFVFTPLTIVIVRLLIRDKTLSDVLVLSAIPVFLVACYLMRAKLILKYHGKTGESAGSFKNNILLL